MKRIALNTLALAALLAGGFSITNTASAAQSSAQLEDVGPTCGKCTCSDGQTCSSTWYGSCKCIGDPG